jgi:tetratricopeptide (TPR) repeat protein
MRWVLAASIYGVLSTTALAARASEGGSSAGDPEEGESKTEDIDAGTITGKAPPPLNPGAVTTPPEWKPEAASELPGTGAYDKLVFVGAKLLRLEVSYVAASREGLEKIYQRDYKGAKFHFDEMATQHRESAIGPVGRAVVWQALMLENFDFKYEKQYEVSFRDAKARLDEALATPGSEAWESFLLAGILGVDAIHVMRKGNFMQALNRGYEAMRSVQACHAAAPDFQDIYLGDGIYNYWRSVVTMSSKMLPDFGDHRAEGIQQMLRSERDSIFLRAPTAMSLAFTYIEERDFKQALVYAQKNHDRYPNNVINNILLARIHIYQRNYPAAENILKETLRNTPENERAHYYLSLIYSRTKRIDEAIAEAQRYLAFKLSPEDRADALYRLGNLLMRQKRYAEAQASWEEAWKINKHKASRKRLDYLAKKQQEGKIPR